MIVDSKYSSQKKTPKTTSMEGKRLVGEDELVVGSEGRHGGRVFAEEGNKSAAGQNRKSPGKIFHFGDKSGGAEIGPLRKSKGEEGYSTLLKNGSA
mmetsp:Transcript_2993/g.2838  ORF Transcript_2993/g.2838 Transcript_2993/m.2838 type:complete len:96 (+) Transcript_2993:1-288(+)